MFQPFEGVPDYPTLEKEVLEFWETRQIFQKLQAQTQNGPRFDFQDGPITANNPMGVHHAWGRTYKDIFNRFYAMRGRKLRWQNGFDCQGLWVEVEVEKALGFKGKPDILAFGMENFSRACRERVEKYADVISEQSKRLGMWMDWERSYFTYDDSNIEHIWLFLKTCHDEGWLAPDYRVMPWCPRCETSLSQHESADSYKEITHRSVFLKFPLQGEKFAGDYVLVWTTTPWTLTANVALAVNPELTYVRAKTDDIVVILSKGTVQSALKPGYEVIEEISGAELIGRTYSGPLDDIPFQVENAKTHPRRVVAASWVGETEGTGIVHIAPGCGADDFELGQVENLGFIAPVTSSAHFKSDCGEVLAGLHALEDAETVFSEVEKRGRLYRIQRYKHSYPHCWRCSHELIFFATQEWFIKTDAGERPARGRLQKAAAEVHWVPEYAGKRMQDWLNNMGDWNISRKRFWGLPLPIYRSADGEVWEVIGSRAELRERAVEPEKVDALPELHRPWIDEIEIWSRDKTQKLTRIPEVGDAWLDAGIVPFSTVGFNGASDIRMPELGLDSPGDWKPADFITEMREQVRLWFFSMLFMGVALKDCAPYKTAMVYETMLDENGEKISKRLQNGVPYDEAVATVGADPMRWTFAGNTLTKDIRFGYKPIHESVRKLLTLWNVYSFFVTYANLDKPDLGKRQEATGNSSAAQNILDKWILARLQTCIAGVTKSVEGIEPAGITREIEAFVEDLSNWYVRRSRRRFWKSESDSDKNAAYWTLHQVLLTVTKLIAPVLPFSSEMMYRNLSLPLEDSPESVHLCAFPTVDEALRDDELVRQVEGVLQAVSLGLSARKDSKIRARQPLSKALIQAPDASGRAGIEAWRDTILDELNVKEIELLDDAGDLVTYSLKANLPLLGKKYGRDVALIRRRLESASQEDAKNIGQAIKRGEEVEILLNEHFPLWRHYSENFVTEETLRVEREPMTMPAEERSVWLLPGEILVTTQQQSGYSFASEGGWSVALDTTLTPKLEDEGFARDFVRGVQQARKEAGFEVSDRIAILLVEPSGETRLPDVLEAFGDYIQSETLADELRFVDAAYPDLSEAKMGDEVLRFRVERVGD